MRTQQNQERLMTGEELSRHPELEPCEDILPGFSLPLSDLFRD